MEQCLKYFRDALYRPEQAPFWDDWWMENEHAVKASFSNVDYLRLKLRKLHAAREVLVRLNAVADPILPIHLDREFIEAIRAIRWFENCGKPCRVAVPFETRMVADWSGAIAASIGLESEDAQLQARNELSLYLHDNHRARYQRWNDIVAAADEQCLNELSEETWQPICLEQGADDRVAISIGLDISLAILAHEYGDCSDRPTFALHRFNLYRGGHFPCGWVGEWPQGFQLVL